MKRLIIALLTVFLCYCFAKAQFYYPPKSDPKYLSINSFYYRYENSHFNKSQSYFKKEKLHHIPVNEKLALVFDEAGEFIYMGEIKLLKSTGAPFPSGEGVCRTPIRNPETGDVVFEYDLCPWKRGSRHGAGLVRLADGSYHQVVWRWNKIKSISEESVEDADIEKFERWIHDLDNYVQLMNK